MFADDQCTSKKHLFPATNVIHNIKEVQIQLVQGCQSKHHNPHDGFWENLNIWDRKCWNSKRDCDGPGSGLDQHVAALTVCWAEESEQAETAATGPESGLDLVLVSGNQNPSWNIKNK